LNTQISNNKIMENSLNVLWTTDNLITTEKMVFMYAHNAKLLGWFEDVTLIIWGASAKLTGENEAVQDKIREMVESGVKVDACKACADQLGVTEKLESLGVVVKYYGEPLTEILKKSGKLITI